MTGGQWQQGGQYPPHPYQGQQGAYPAQPYQGQQGGWGTPPPPPPKRKRRVGLIIGITLGAIVVLLAAAFTTWRVIALSAETGFPDVGNDPPAECAVPVEIRSSLGVDARTGGSTMDVVGGRQFACTYGTAIGSGKPSRGLDVKVAVLTDADAARAFYDRTLAGMSGMVRDSRWGEATAQSPEGTWAGCMTVVLAGSSVVQVHFHGVDKEFFDERDMPFDAACAANKTVLDHKVPKLG